MLTALLVLTVLIVQIDKCAGQRRPPVRSDLTIVRGDPANLGELTPGRPGAQNLPIRLQIFQQIVAQLARANLYQPEDPFEPVYRVEGFDFPAINWRHRLPIVELAPNFYPSDPLREELYAANFLDNNVPDTGYPNPYDPRRFDRFSTRPGFQNVPGFGGPKLGKRKKRSPLFRRKRQAPPTTEPAEKAEPSDLAKAAAEAGLSSSKFDQDDFRRIAEAQEQERQRAAELRAAKAAEDERRRIQDYIDSLGLNRASQPVPTEDLQYNRNCLRHFRGPFPHPSYLNGVLVDACNQPIPSEYILGARPDRDSKKGQILKYGDYRERHAGYDFLGRPIPQPDTSDPLYDCEVVDGGEFEEDRKRPGHGRDGDNKHDRKNGRGKHRGKRNAENNKSRYRYGRKCKNPAPGPAPDLRDPFMDIPTVRPVYPIDPLTGKLRNPGINFQTYSRLLAGFVPRGQNPLPQLRNIYENAEGTSFFGNNGK